MRSLSLFITGTALALASAGCATTTRITIHSTDRTNDGAPMYMMVRSWDGKPTFNERYQEVAAKAFVEPPDATVLATKPILPGEEKTTVTINADTAKEIIVYFFFTDPGPGWQIPVRRPLPADIDIDLGRHDVENVRTKPR
jgi:azurin